MGVRLEAKSNEMLIESSPVQKVDGEEQGKASASGRQLQRIEYRSGGEGNHKLTTSDQSDINFSNYERIACISLRRTESSYLAVLAENDFLYKSSGAVHTPSQAVSPTRYLLR